MKTARAYTSPSLAAGEIVSIQLQPFRNIYVHKAPGIVYLKTPAGYWVPIVQPMGIESPDIIEGGVFEAYCDAAGQFTLITTLLERITGGATEGVRTTITPPGANRVHGRDAFGTTYASWATYAPNPVLIGVDYGGSLGVLRRFDSRNLAAAPCNVPFYPTIDGLKVGYQVPESSGQNYLSLDVSLGAGGVLTGSLDVWGALSFSGTYVFIGNKANTGLSTFNVKGYNNILITPSIAPAFDVTNGVVYGTIFW